MARVLLVVVALALLLVACEPDEDAVDSTPTDGPGHTEVSFNDRIIRTSAAGADAGYSGNYTMRANVEGVVIAGAVNVSRSGPRTRADFRGLVDGQETEVIVMAGPRYPDEDMFYMCVPDDGSCVEVRPDASGYPEEMLPALVAVRLLDVPIFTTGMTFADETTRDIAGVAATCFVGQVEVGEGGAIDHGEVCLTEGGIPLLVTGAGGETTMSIAATAAPETFDVSSFELPYSTPAAVQ